MNTRITAVRKRTRMTQAEFGKALGVSRNVIASFEYGRVVPNDTFIQLLCAKYSINEAWLRTGEGDMLRQDASSILDRLSEEYRLTPREISVVSAFLELNEADRAAVMRFVDGMVDRLAPPSIPDTAAAAIATMQDYADMVAGEKEAEGKSSTSAG